ncbi:MAG: hypothetical protein PHV98_03420 [Candidatus Omnitrophica bacterium]|nr:hypothetical protein [Candidatus Omnitrophota bacterium]
MVKRLYAPGGVVSQTIYVTEPVSSPKIYQENGDIVLQTLGSGNVLLSAATGLQLFGKQVVIEATSLNNPLIYLAANTRIDGDTSISGTVGITGDLGVGGTFSSGAMDIAGDLTVTGDTTITGDLTIVGNENITGVRTITASSTEAVLTVTQTGTGDILNLFDGSTEVLTVIDGGNVGIGTSTPSYPLHVVGESGQANLFVVESNFGGGGTTFALKNTSTTGDVAFDFYSGSSLIGNMGYITSDGTPRFFILENNQNGLDLSLVDNSLGHGGDVAIGTTTPRYKLDVWGDLGIGTSTSESVPALYVDTGDGGRVGIGTTTLSGLFTVGTTTPALVVNTQGKVDITGALYQDFYGSDDGLVLYLPFSEGMTSSSANTIFDQSPYGNDGTATNMPMPSRNATSGESGWATTTCKTGSCMTFDGVNDYVNVANDWSLNMPSAMTVEAWVKPSTLNTALGIAGRYYGAGDYMFNFRVESDNRFRFRVDDSASASYYAYSTTLSQPGEFFHVVGTYGNSTINIYVNGILESSQPGGADILQTVTNLAIGDIVAGTLTQPFNGLIDEFRIYNRALSANEVRSHYLRGVNTNGAILANKFRVVNTTNTIAFQIDGAGNSYFNTANLGVGTTTPRYKFDVWGDLAVGTSTSTNTPLLYVDSGTGYGGVGIGTTTLSGNLLTVGTTTPSLVVASNGYVGIGTSTPLSSLHIDASHTGVGNSITMTITEGTKYNWLLGVNNNIDQGFEITHSSAIAGTEFTNPMMVFKANTNYIGIATSSPRYKLHVYGDFAAGTSTAGYVGVTSTPALYVDSGDGGRIGIGTTTLAGLLTVGTSTPSLVVAPNGFVGIGTTTPEEMLEIVANGSTDFMLKLSKSVSGVGENYIKLVGDTQSWDFGIGENTHSTVPNTFSIGRSGIAYDFVIDSSGNFGMGTTSPRYKLDVWGDLAIGTSTSTNVPLLYVDSGSGYGSVGIGTTTLSGTLFTVGTTTPSLAVASNGYVGIGTTTPTDKLHIAGFLRTENTNWTLAYDFGSSVNNVVASAVYNGKLYAGTGSGDGEGDVYVYDGSTWSLSNDFGATINYVWDLAVYNGKLYVGTGSGDGEGDVYVYDGSTWSLSNDFGATINSASRLVVFNNKLYVGLSGEAGEADVYYFDGSTWSLSNDFAATVEAINSMAVYNGKLYVGTGTGAGDGDVWVYDGAAWSLNHDFGATIDRVPAMGVYNGKLYAGLGSGDDEGDVYVYDGSTWTLSRDFGNAINYIRSMGVYNGKLYVGTGANDGDGDLHTFDGSNWTTTTDFGSTINYVFAPTVYNGKLYIGLGSDDGEGDIYVYSERLEAQLAKDYEPEKLTLNEQYQHFLKDITVLGNIGAGTSTPRYKLDVWGDMGIGTSTDTNTPLLYVDSGSGYGSVGIGTTTLSGTLLTVGTTTPSLVVASNGYVGIGTVTPGSLSPSSKLDVAGSIPGEDVTILVHNTDNTNTESHSTLQSIVAGASGGDPRLLLTISAVRDWSIGVDNSDSDIFKIGYSSIVGQNTVLALDTSGSVSIATSSSRYTLDVWGDLAVGTSTGVNVPMDYPLLYVNSGEGGMHNGVGIGTTTVAGTMLRVGTSTIALAVGDNGYVGVGATSSVARFSVNNGKNGLAAVFGYGDSQLQYIAVGNNGAQTYQIQLGYHVGAEYGNIQAIGSTTTDYRSLAIQAAGGNTGVGTTTPRYKLDVWGDIAIGTSTGQIPALYVDSGRGGGVISYSSTTIANYLSVGTSTIPNLFVDSGNGYVGIGTTTPGLTHSSLLEVYKDVNGSATIQVTNRNPGTGANALFLASADSGDAYFGINSTANTGVGSKTAYVYTTAVGGVALRAANAAGNIRLYTGGDGVSYERMRVDSSGNIGIGNTGPTSKLTVNGGDIVVSSTGAATTTISSGISYFAGGIISLASSTIANNLSVGTSSTPTLFVDSGNGKVGIGTASPGTPMAIDVNTANTNTAYVSDGVVLIGNSNATDNNFSGVWFSQGVASSSATIGAGILGIHNDHTVGSRNSQMAFYTTNNSSLVEKMRILDTGLVGIGTADPSQKLTVYGGNVAVTTNGTATSTISSATSTLAGGLTVDTSTLYIMSDTDNVGIGTIAPKMKLHIDSSTTGDPIALGSVQSNGTFRINGGNNSVLDIGVQTADGDWWLQSTDQTDLSVNYNILLNPNGGNVAIGTTAPVAQFNVQGSSSIAGTDLTNARILAGTATVGIGIDSNEVVSKGGQMFVGTIDNNSIALIVNNSDRLTVDTSGYVGIGTTSPDRMLHVVTTGDIGAIIEDDDNAVLLLRDTGAASGRQSAGFKWNSPKLSIVSTTDAYASQTEFLTVDMSTGYVGIGTASPSAKLDIVYNPSDQSAFSEILRIQRATTGTSVNNLGGYINMQVEDDSGSMKDAGHIGAILTDVSSANVSSAIVFKTRTANGSLTEKLRIDGSGNIGIGTTTPRYKLDVWGDMVIGTTTNSGGVNMPLLYVDSGNGAGKIGIATSTPRYSLDVWGSLAVGTSTSPVFFVDTGVPSVTFGADVSLGSIQVASSSGAITFVDMIVEASAAAGTEESYSFQIDSQELFRIYAESDGSGGIQNKRIIYPSGVNFAISTTSARYALDVWGDLAVGTSTGVGIPMNYPLLYVNSGEGGTYNGVGIGTTTVSGTMFTVGTTTPSLVVSQNGYVGIKTASPTQMLDMGDGNSGANIKLSSNSEGSYVLFDSNGTDFKVGHINNTSAIQIGQTNNIMLSVATQSVGVGDSSPDFGLEIATSTSSGYFGISSSDSGDGDVLIVNSSGNVGIGTTTPGALFTVDSDASQAFVVDGSGHVGIGTTNPGVSLSIYKNSGTGLIVYSNTESNDAIKLYNDGTLSYIQGVNDRFALWDSSGESITLKSGNVGIGNTSPTSKLTVSGGNIIVSSSGSATTTISSGISYFAGGIISLASSTIANNLSVGTSSTPALFVDSGNGYAIFSTPNVSSALTINEPRIEATLPLYVNVEGNVGFAYDLEFTDPDLAKIIAGGNLAIEAGTPGMYQDLRLKTRGLGNVLVDISNASSSYSGGFKVLGSNGVLLTVGEPGQVKLRNDTGLVIGEMNQKVIDDFEDATTVDWTSYSSANVAVNSAESSTVKVGNYSLNIAATTSSEDVYVVKNFSAAQDWSAYERLGFWIRASKIATSSATTTQIISAAIYGSANNVTSTHQIYIQEANAWQYEEWTIEDIQNSTSVDRIAFRMDVSGTSVINFYIDQIRAYNSNERSGEMFVGKDGSLTLLGRGTVEIGRADGSSNKPAVKVDSAIVEFNQPMSVNVGGDVGINYDLQFLNTGASYITSEGSLWIQAGDSNHADNLYLTTGGTGDVVVELSTSSQSFVVAGTNRYLDVTYAGVVGIGETSPLAFGDFNSQIIDNMEGSVLDWRSYNTTYVTTSTELSVVKVGSQALNIAATTASEDVFVAKSYTTTQDWSPYERISFWIRASQLATSTATTTQMLSVGIFGSTNNSSTTHQINIQKEDRWQYEEWNIDNIQNSTSVDKIFFRIDVGSISSTNFYIDHIRLYDSDERAADLFVDKDGTLVVTGRNSVELYAPQAGAGNLPGVKVDAAVVELGQPLSVNVGGDVGFDYDLQFLNTGMAQITSEGPLRIAAGDSNHSENLTLTTGGSGDVIVELTASSSSFMITHAWAASTTVPFVLNSESNSTTTAEMDKLGVLFQIISDYSTDENTVFSIDASGNFYYDRGAYTPAADVAENYYVNDENIRGGDVVCLASNALTVEKCSSAYESDLLGVISTQPALLMGNDMSNARPVALNGRVPVKISLENGPIAIGDSLTSASSTPGVAMKATGSGKILGYALEPFDGSATSSDMIYAFINLQDRSAGDLSVFENTDGGLEIRTLTESGLTALFTIDDDGALVVSKIKTQQLCVGSVCVTENEFMEVFGAGVGELLIPEDGGVCTNGTNQPCSSEVGACQIGVQICEGGVWGECIGAVFPTDEICDEVDNDCDGEVDEGGVCIAPEPEPEPISTSTEPIITTTTTPDVSTTTATTTE